MPTNRPTNLVNSMVKFLRKKAEKNSFLQGVSLIIVAKQTAVGHPVYVCMIMDLINA